MRTLSPYQHQRLFLLDNIFLSDIDTHNVFCQPPPCSIVQLFDNQPLHQVLFYINRQYCQKLQHNPVQLLSQTIQLQVYYSVRSLHHANTTTLIDSDIFYLPVLHNIVTCDIFLYLLLLSGHYPCSQRMYALLRILCRIRIQTYLLLKYLSTKERHKSNLSLRQVVSYPNNSHSRYNRPCLTRMF